MNRHNEATTANAIMRGAASVKRRIAPRTFYDARRMGRYGQWSL
jgi:hypothetical protein